MMAAIRDYFAELIAQVSDGWTGFWFMPSDPATLCAMRLFVGLVAVYLHATLSLDLLEFFGPAGLLPVDQIAPLEAGNFSYLNFLTSPGELWAAHLIGLAVLLMFTVGFWTRLSAILALVVFLSDVHRAPMITSRTEMVVAMVLCYLCLAPCGRRFSLDAWLAGRGEMAAGGSSKPAVSLSTSATIATRLIQIHLALLVAMMGFSMLSSESWWTGMGVWWLVGRQYSRLVDLTWLHATPKAVELWSHAIVAFEIAFPLLIWVPILRPLLLAIALAIWTSLALVSGELTLAVALAIAAMSFISPALMRQCLHRAPRPAQAAA